MTYDELRELIAEAINSDDWANRGPDGDADAVLAAIASNGLVIGVKVKQGDSVQAIVKNGNVTFPDSLALVRVVAPHE